MNTHVPPPAEEKTRSAGIGATAEARVRERPRPAGDAKSPDAPPQQTPQTDPRQPRSDAGVKVNDQGQAQTPPEETAPLGGAFWTWRLLSIAAIVIAAIVGLLIWSPWSASEPKVAYRYTSVATGTVAVKVTSTAILEPRDPAEVVVQEGGRVSSVLVKSGDHVVKGQPLVHLVSDSARAELASAQAELAARQSNLVRSEADLTEARATLMRLRNDPKPGAIDAASARLARVVANTDEARALLRAGEAGVASSRAALESLDIRAPSDGVVLKTNVAPQGDVRAVTRGQSVVTMAGDLSQLNLRADFSESALGSLRLGARADFTAPAFPQRTFAATLTALDIWPRRESRDGRQFVTFGGVLTAPNPDGVLRPGMSANVAVIVAEARDALLVPNTALAFVPPPKIEAKFAPLKSAVTPSGARLGRVWVLEGDSPEPRDVTLGLSDGRVTQITGGSLRAGEKIITSALIAAGT